ncbi:MAG: hypothetical protein AAF202_04290, partial [Pseudomonadota bacterium]
LAVVAAMYSQIALSQYGSSGGGLFSGDFALGIAGGITATGQGDINELQSRANRRETISTSALGNAWEISGYLQYRYANSFLALQFRPSYFLQTEEGNASNGEDYEYGVSGYTLFPVAKFHMLEDDSIKFFTTVGVGIGYVAGEIIEGPAAVEFSGTDVGYMVGSGAEFCFLGGFHCVSIEGNYRFLVIDRVTADDFSGTNFDDGSITQPNDGFTRGEVEFDNEDLQIDLSGVQGLVGYVYHFK